MTVIAPASDRGSLPEPPASWQYSLQVPHDPLGPAIVRSTVRMVLDQHGLNELADTAELLTSELATNAYRYSTGPASVRLKWTDDTLRISVWDTNPALPSPIPADLESEGGRGLLLVRLCSDNWGRYALTERQVGSGGKVVWCEVRHPGATAS
ncbi:ATP-binding protein [Streptomyces sp. bgisy100]|uniref:ATP-binding protein n=1 Tax=Streptomyces sp. bgisy100 TaxID=3413783 RepID=UPI003D727F8E